MRILFFLCAVYKFIYLLTYLLKFLDAAPSKRVTRHHRLIHLVTILTVNLWGLIFVSDDHLHVQNFVESFTDVHPLIDKISRVARNDYVSSCGIPLMSVVLWDLGGATAATRVVRGGV